MTSIRFRRALSLLLPALALTACTTVDFSQPEIPLAEPYRHGADIRLVQTGGSTAFGSAVEGPSLDILRDQLLYGAVRCSRPGPKVDLEVLADFIDDGGPNRDAQHLIGIATWRDPETRQIVGRHHLDVAMEIDWTDRAHVNVSEDDDGFGSFVTRGQLVAGEAFAEQLCEKAFG